MLVRRFSCDEEIIECVCRLVGYPLTGLTSEQGMNPSTEAGQVQGRYFRRTA